MAHKALDDLCSAYLFNLSSHRSASHSLQLHGLTFCSSNTPSSFLSLGFCLCYSFQMILSPKLSNASFLHFIQVSAQKLALQKDFHNYIKEHFPLPINIPIPSLFYFISSITHLDIVLQKHIHTHRGSPHFAHFLYAWGSVTMVQLKTPAPQQHSSNLLP